VKLVSASGFCRNVSFVRAGRRLGYLICSPISLGIVLVIWFLRPWRPFKLFVLPQRIGPLLLAIAEHRQSLTKKPPRGLAHLKPPRYLCYAENTDSVNWAVVNEFRRDCGWIVMPRSIMVPAVFGLRRIGPLRKLEYQQGAEAKETRMVHESFALLRSEVATTEVCSFELGNQVSIGRPIISWVNRDSKYLESLGLETSHHEYRNCSIRNYSMAVSRALSLGYGCIRIGRLTDEPLALTHERFLDYSQSALRSDKNDLHIAECSDLLITCSTGIDFLYTLLGVPTVGVNLPTVDARFDHHLLSLPKHLYVDDGLTTFELPIMALTSRDLKWSGHRPSLWKGLPVRLGENSPEEIEEAVVLALQMLGDPSERERHRTMWQPLWADFWMRAKDSNLDEAQIGLRPTLVLPNSALSRFLAI